MSTPVRRTAVAAVVTLALGLGVGACSGDDPGEPGAESPSTTSSVQAAERIIKTKVSMGQTTGRMDRKTRHRLMREVGEVVDRWTYAAYLGGDYPRRAFQHSWPGFTRGAQVQARHDRTLMSNQAIGQRIDGVRPRRSVVALDVLAVRGRPQAVTARVHLVFRTTGKLERTVRVHGRLFLTRTGEKRQWRVFGYDVAKGEV